MSNFTAKRRSGGGGTPGPSLARMILAVKTGAEEIEVTYDRDITAIDFSPEGFTAGGLFESTSVALSSAAQIVIQFGTTISGPETLADNNQTPGVLPEQEIPYST